MILNSRLKKVLFLMQYIIQAYVTPIISLKCSKIWVWNTEYKIYSLIKDSLYLTLKKDGFYAVSVAVELKF